MQNNLTNAVTSNVDNAQFNTRRLTEADFQKDSAQYDTHFGFITESLDFQSFGDSLCITRHLIIPTGSQNHFQNWQAGKEVFLFIVCLIIKTTVCLNKN